MEKLSSESISTEAVKNLLKTTKAARKKLQRVQIAISRKGIIVTDLQGNDIFKVSIFRQVLYSENHQLNSVLTKSNYFPEFPTVPHTTASDRFSPSFQPMKMKRWNVTVSCVEIGKWQKL